MAKRLFMQTRVGLAELIRHYGDAFKEDFYNPKLSSMAICRRWQIDNVLIRELRRVAEVKYIRNRMFNLDKHRIAMLVDTTKTHRELADYYWTSINTIRRARRSLGVIIPQMRGNQMATGNQRRAIIDADSAEEASRLTGIDFLVCVRIRWNAAQKMQQQ